MRAHDGRDRIRKLNLLDDLRAHDGMNLHLREFLGRQLAGLRENVFGHRQLSNVVEQRRRLQGLQFFVVQPKVLADAERIFSAPLRKCPRVFRLSFASTARARPSIVRM